MPIEYSSADRTFFLHAGEATYAMKVLTHGFLAHLYWGKKIGIQELDFVFQLRERAFSPNPDGLGKEFSLDTLPLEYPVYGTTDFRWGRLRSFSLRMDRESWTSGSRLIALSPENLRSRAFLPLGSKTRAKRKHLLSSLRMPNSVCAPNFLTAPSPITL